MRGPEQEEEQRASKLRRLELGAEEEEAAVAPEHGRSRKCRVCSARACAAQRKKNKATTFLAHIVLGMQFLVFGFRTNAVRGTESKSAAAGLRVDHERRSRDLARKLRAREAMSGADSHRLADAGAIWRFNPQAFMWDFRCLAIEQLMADRYGPSTASLINLLLKTVRLKSLQVQPL